MSTGDLRGTLGWPGDARGRADAGVRRRYFTRSLPHAPWEAEPRVLIQAGSGGAAKAYQVAQALDAIDKLTTEGQDNG